MVLLFIMQRMGYKQWGLHPLFEPEPEHTGEIIVECEEDKDNLDKQGQDKRKSQKKRVDLTISVYADVQPLFFQRQARRYRLCRDGPILLTNTLNLLPSSFVQKRHARASPRSSKKSIRLRMKMTM
jgi:hypothetical protein